MYKKNERRVRVRRVGPQHNHGPGGCAVVRHIARAPDVVAKHTPHHFLTADPLKGDVAMTGFWAL